MRLPARRALPDLAGAKPSSQAAMSLTWPRRQGSLVHHAVSFRADMALGGWAVGTQEVEAAVVDVNGECPHYTVGDRLVFKNRAFDSRSISAYLGKE